MSNSFKVGQKYKYEDRILTIVGIESSTSGTSVWYTIRPGDIKYRFELGSYMSETMTLFRDTNCREFKVGSRYRDAGGVLTVVGVDGDTVEYTSSYGGQAVRKFKSYSPMAHNLRPVFETYLVWDKKDDKPLSEIFDTLEGAEEFSKKIIISEGSESISILKVVGNVVEKPSRCGTRKD